MASQALSRAEIATNRFAVLATYRHLLRATKIAFSEDDIMLRSSRAFARSEFRTGAKLIPNGPEAAQGVEHAQGVAQILRENVVQGVKVGEVGEKYKLNIHEHTQRLDNDTAGKLKGTTKSFKEVKSESLL